MKLGERVAFFDDGADICIDLLDRTAGTEGEIGALVRFHREGGIDLLCMRTGE
ncbi:hypothetical protein D3C81_2080410 [compost metagenome]